MRLFAIPRGVLSLCATLGLVSLVAIAGCSDDDDDKNPVNPGATSTQLTGTFANAAEGGLMTVTIQSGVLAPALRGGSLAAHEVTASAVITPEGGAPVNLTGTYSEESDTLNLTGGGYVMVGEFESTTHEIIGGYTGPNGPGFFGCAVGGTGAVDVFCGTFEDESQTASGSWNVVISGTHLRGISAIGESLVPFAGTVSGTGTTRTVAVNHGLGEGATLVADGLLDTSTHTIGGSWRVDDNGTTVIQGTWMGAACGSGGGGPGTSEFRGTFISAGEGGLMTLSINSEALARVKPAASMRSDVVTASAVLTLDAGGSYTIPGAYDTDTNTLALVGSGYTMTGEYDDTGSIPAVLGQYTGPSGPGFFAVALGDESTIRVFCGSYLNQDLTTGRWNLVIIGLSELGGIAFSPEGDSIPFEGTVTGTGATRTLNLTGNDESTGGVLTATATLDTVTNTITNGTYTLEVDSTPVGYGTWSGELCPSPAP